mgnify:CR=1 FL=1
MRQLMISLDKNILNKDSAVARRMIEYGKEKELFIIIPDRGTEVFDLSSTVHVQSTGGNKLLQFFRLLYLSKNIIHNSKFIIQNSLVTVQDPFFTGLIGWLLKKKFKIKLEMQMHGDFFSDYYKRQWLKLSLAKFVLKRAETIRVVGERIKQSLLNLNISENKIIVRSVPIDAEFIKNYQPKINLHEKYPSYEKIFLVLGRLDPVKNIPWLIEVFKEVAKQKNFLLLIVGGSLEEGKLMFNVPCSMFHKNIAFEPWTNDPISYLKTADCLLFPSLSEGYGLVPMEASVVGTPVIMNDVGVANYELKPSENVKILPINNKDALVKAILEI